MVRRCVTATDLFALQLVRPHALTHSERLALAEVDTAEVERLRDPVRRFGGRELHVKVAESRVLVVLLVHVNEPLLELLLNLCGGRCGG